MVSHTCMHAITPLQGADASVCIVCGDLQQVLIVVLHSLATDAHTVTDLRDWAVHGASKAAKDFVERTAT